MKLLSCLFALVLFGNIYSDNTTQFSRPNNKDVVIGEFGARTEFGPKALRFVGGVNSLVSAPSGSRTITGIQYEAGVKLSLVPRVTFSAMHGSWHHVDNQGPSQMYNRIGVEVKVQ